jgi:hypothetical protein
MLVSRESVLAVLVIGVETIATFLLRLRELCAGAPGTSTSTLDTQRGTAASAADARRVGLDKRACRVYRGLLRSVGVRCARAVCAGVLWMCVGR